MNEIATAHARARADALFGLRPGGALGAFAPRAPRARYAPYLEGDWPVDPRGDFGAQGAYYPAWDTDGIAPGFSARSSRTRADDGYGNPNLDPQFAYSQGLAPGGEARRAQLRRQAMRRRQEAYDAQFDALTLADARRRGAAFWRDLAERVADRRAGIPSEGPMPAYFGGMPNEVYTAGGYTIAFSGTLASVGGSPTMAGRRFSYPPRFFPAGYVSNPRWYGSW